MALNIFLVLTLISMVNGECIIKCTPEDEFEDGKTSEEWDTFMAHLVSNTFTHYDLPCFPPNETSSISISEKSQFIWDLRFKIYNERQNSMQNTLNDCYCQHDDCESPAFRKCLADVRKAMEQELVSFWTMEIMNELWRRQPTCDQSNL